MAETTLLSDSGVLRPVAASERPPRLALALMWCRAEPSRVGEIILPPPRLPVVLGRGPGEGREARARLVRQRPGHNEATAALADPRLSRRQLSLELRAGALRARSLGRRPLRRNGRVVEEADLEEGDHLEVDGRLLFRCVLRPLRLPSLRAWPEEHQFAFGEADEFGVVGESPELWALRDRLAWAAARPLHILLHGPSGTGKELAARTLHALSDRAAQPLVSRSAATLPEGLIDAELFGNAANWPNPGTPARIGLFAEAHGGTLFLDEIGELPEALQAHLLRVLDRDGEYQRLGEDRRRRSDFRFLAATNRPLDSLKHDLLPRFALRIECAGLRARLADLPLIVRHLLRQMAADDEDIRARFCPAPGPSGRHEPRVSVALIDALLGHSWRLNVRELQGLLWRAVLSSSGDRLGLSPEVAEELSGPAGPLASPHPGGGALLAGSAQLSDRADGIDEIAVAEVFTDPASLRPADIQACLDRHPGHQAAAWRELGLKNRYVLRRLVRKHGLRLTPAPADPG